MRITHNRDWLIRVGGACWVNPEPLTRNVVLYTGERLPATAAMDKSPKATTKHVSISGSGDEVLAADLLVQFVSNTSCFNLYKRTEHL